MVIEKHTNTVMCKDDLFESLRNKCHQIVDIEKNYYTTINKLFKKTTENILKEKWLEINNDLCSKEEEIKNKKIERNNILEKMKTFIEKDKSEGLTSQKELFLKITTNVTEYENQLEILKNERMDVIKSLDVLYSIDNKLQTVVTNTKKNIIKKKNKEY